MKALSHLLSLLLLLTLACESPRPAARPAIQGLCLVASPEDPDRDSFRLISETGAGWVAIVPYAFNRPGQSEIYFNTERQWRGEREEGVKLTIRLAHEAGLKVMLKPHIWVSGQGWMGDFTLGNDEVLWQNWEKSYTDYLLFYAKICDSLGVDMLCIGTEMRQVVRERPEFWPVLIAKIRNVYKGKLTYAANWDNYEQVTFWSELDYIGVDAYFPLSDEAVPTQGDLTEAWEPLAQDMASLAKKEGKQILFTEYGYESTTYPAAGHWKDYKREWNEEAQAVALHSLYDTFWKDKEWFAGGFLWKWHPTRLTMAHGEDKEKYTVQEKEALATVKSWYRRPEKQMAVKK